MKSYFPPTILDCTWLQLTCNNSEYEAQIRAIQMLNHNFGSIDIAIAYLGHSLQKNAG